MSTRKENILVCDTCAKEQSDGGKTSYGGHPFSGWLVVRERCHSTQLSKLQKQTEFDFCSVECLLKKYTPPPSELEKFKTEFDEALAATSDEELDKFFAADEPTELEQFKDGIDATCDTISKFRLLTELGTLSAYKYLNPANFDRREDIIEILVDRKILNVTHVVPSSFRHRAATTHFTFVGPDREEDAQTYQDAFGKQLLRKS